MSKIDNAADQVKHGVDKAAEATKDAAKATGERLSAPMSIRLQTSGVHHVTLRSTDLARSRRFYVDTLGFPVALETKNLLVTLAGSTAVVVRGPDTNTPAGDVFNPFRVGLDHVALACTSEAELERVALALRAADVESTGVKLDETLGKKYVAFKDPDRIAWEFYMA